MNQPHELKKVISYYLIGGNNLKPYLGKPQLTELKANLDTLKGIISEKEWDKLIGRKYNCFLMEIEFKIAEWDHGTHPNQDRPQPIPSPTPSKPDQIDQKPEPVKPDPVIIKPDETKPTPKPDGQEQKPDKLPDQVDQKPHEPTAEEIKAQQEKEETAKYDKLLSEIKGEIDPSKLEEGKHYDQEINKLNEQLLPLNKQPNYLHDARKQRKDDLNDKEKEEKWQAWFKQRQILNETDQKAWRSLTSEKEAEALFTEALKSDEDNKPWDPQLTQEESELLSKSTSPGSLKDNRHAVKAKRDNITIAKELLNDLENWTELASMPRSKDIQAKYNEEWVPETLKYAVLKATRNNTRAKLFKTAFQGVNPSQLTDEQIEAWRKGSDSEREGKTGLDGNGIEERTAFNNKWEIKEIVNRKVNEYKQEPETIRDIDPLKVNKDQLKTALEILKDINDPNKTTFKSLPENYRETEIKALPNDLPGVASPANLTARIKARRSLFSLSLNQTDDEAFTQEKLDAILLKFKERYPMAEYKAFTHDLANEILRWNITGKESINTKTKKPEPVPVPKLTPSIDEDLEAWLTDPEQKGYRIEDEPAQFIEGAEPIKNREYTGAEVVKQEDEWALTNQRDKQSKLLLPFFCKKINYDYNNPEAFLIEPGNKTKGKLPYATGSGKTTKIIMCLTCLMLAKGRNVLLVLPTQLLKSSAAGHHKSWLQDYECSLHDKKHGEYKVNVDELGEGLSILYYPFLIGYINRELLNWKSKALAKLTEEAEKIKDGVLKGKIQAVKEGTLLKKLNPIIVFDEDHWADSTYQATKELTETLNYECLEMSATFKGVPWSITTPYKGIDRKVDGFKPEHIQSTDKTGIFIKNRLTDEQKKILTDAGVCWVEFDEGMAPAAEGITMGLPPGAVFFFTWIYGAGVTMDLKNIILTNWLETSKLGAGWQYAPPETQKCDIANLGQQRGRVNRLYKGRAYFLTDKDGVLKYEDIKQTDDAGTVFTKYSLTGDEKWKKKITYKDFHDLNLTRLSLAWPDKFGLRPEEILIGVKTGIIPGGTFPQFPEVLPPGRPDLDLWDRHRKIIKPNDMPIKTAKDILSQMIGNLLVSNRKGNQFPNMIGVEIESPLIQQIKWLSDNKKAKKKDPKEADKWIKQDNTASIEECRSMINGKIAQELRKLTDYKEGAIKYKNEATFNKIVGIYKMIDGLNITIKQEFTEDYIDKKNKELGFKPKDSLTLRISYGQPAAQRKINDTFFYDTERERERERANSNQ